MDQRLILTLCVLASWLIGSIPFSLLIARFVAGIDLRKHGSGNVGATNVARTLGAKWGLLALLMDAAKGGLPVLLLPILLRIPEDSLTNIRVLSGIAAILGHMFPPWLGFRGGKGVATALGVVLVLSPWATGCSFFSFFLVFTFSRIVSLSSIVAALTFAIVEIAFSGPELWTRHNWGLGVFSIAIPLMILIQHRSNFVRLWRGEEKQLEFNSSEKQKPETTEVDIETPVGPGSKP